MLYQARAERRRLLDSYLMALSIQESVKRSGGQTTAREQKDAQDQLVLANDKYWLHVEQHGALKISRFLNRETLLSALRVLMGCCYGTVVRVRDVEVVRSHSQNPSQSLDYMARTVADQVIGRRTDPMDSSRLSGLAANR